MKLSFTQELKEEHGDRYCQFTNCSEPATKEVGFYLDDGVIGEDEYYMTLCDKCHDIFSKKLKQTPNHIMIDADKLRAKLRDADYSSNQIEHFIEKVM